MPTTWDSPPPTPEEALARLQAGNLRFREGGPPSLRGFRRDQSNVAQRPFAIILGCSDSRTPVEVLFDQGFGDLFVVRVAGNIVAPSIVGSIEFAASQFGSRLVVVMGHTRCGAVTATVKALQTGLDPASRNIRSITDRIAPHIEELVRHSQAEGPVLAESTIQEAVRANVRASADHLRHGSQILEELVLAGRLAVVGAEYNLDTGEVVFLEGQRKG